MPAEPTGGEPPMERLAAILPPLLQSMESLGFIARHFHPGELSGLLDATEAPFLALTQVAHRLADWPDEFRDVSARLSEAAAAIMGAREELEAAAADGDLGGVFRALRRRPQAEEALFPLACGLPPVSRYFISPALRHDAALQARLAAEAAEPIHISNDRGERGGFSAYGPQSEAAAPLVVALHGGSGHGRSFLWSWLRDARSLGAALIAPTSNDRTWSFHEPDADIALLERALDFARLRWAIDEGRILLTGMSDGGTFSYIAGLQGGSPFTHLAPISASFHPMLGAMAGPGRIHRLPTFIVHGARDWMFAAETARMANQLFSAAGAAVTYREVADLSHTYPSEMNLEILRWLIGGDA